MKKEAKRLLAEIALLIIICNYNNIIIMAILWIFFHELAHILLAKKFGCKFYNIEFHIFGMRAELLDMDDLRENQKLLVYLSGALFNILIAIVLYIVNTKYNSEFIKSNIDLNIGLAAFNLLPAYPLDGSRIFEIILSKKMLYKKAQKVISIISYLIASLFIIIFICIYIFLHSLNISMIIGSIIIIYVTKIEEHSTMYITMGNIVKKRNNLLKNKYIENKSISVYCKQGLINVLSLVDRNKFNIFYILDDEMNLIYILNEDELMDALKVYGNMTLEEYINKKYKIQD